MEVAVGSEYSTFGELSVAIRRWEENNFVTLYKRSSRSIAATRKRAPKRSFNDELQFSELDYACVHGGREYKPKSSNKRKNQKYVSVFLPDNHRVK